MSEKMREILKSKNIINIVVLFVLGVGLLLFGRFGLDNSTNSASVSSPVYSVSNNTPNNFANDLERRLSEAFSRIEGAGQVHVILNFVNTESVFARDVNQSETNIAEADSGGGSRTQQTQSTIANYVLSGGGPLVLRESERVVAGIIIIAEGGGNIHVIEALTNAARSLLGIEPHRISVLAMNNSTQ
ncbi:MAG: hypothetical protein FWF50_00850 [Defluviitaleaceae bacterium]|nr:hypothetical protein [Defluviitaleaceae bacterium]